ncbi:MAG TPA: protein-glutamate O-methyltransferase CheR, partial [Polyangiaceae bacterium]|nr:protein-glutamate O-methyltransferase CheR [Polyangiaceae bacterium]
MSVDRPAALQQEWLAAFVGLVKERFGHVVASRRESTFWRAVLEACLACGETSLERYFARLSSEPLDSPAVGELVSRFTIKESYFFRDEQLMSVLREAILPSLIERSSGRGLTIWSAGCSLGEEAYTLSILLQELTAGRQGFQFNVVASDLDEVGLARARAAEYSEWSLRSLGAEARDRYFERHGSRFVLRQRWRKGVRFETHNLVDPVVPPPSPGVFDLVLCRNVAIYFSEAALGSLHEKLLQALAPDGLLLFAPSDPRPTNEAELSPLIIRHAGRGVVGYVRPGSVWS